jgi:hypothetical protein
MFNISSNDFSILAVMADQKALVSTNPGLFTRHLSPAGRDVANYLLNTGDSSQEAKRFGAGLETYVKDSW